MTVRLSARTWSRLVLYAGAIAAIFAGVGWALATHQGDIKEGLLRFFLPDDWMFIGEPLLERFINPQSLLVLINAAVTGAVVLVSMLTFPLKELLSASYERDSKCTGGRRAHAPPLWEQAFEEIKLVLFYGAMTLMVLRLGHEADPTTRVVALVLSNLLLFITVAIDFGSPTLARHGVRYADIVRALASRPLRSLAFGATFGLPPVLAGWALVKLQVAVPVAFVVLAGVNLICLVIAVLAGTVVGGTLLPKAETYTPLGAGPKFAGWALIFGLLGVNGTFFGGAAQALYYVSPVLKCDWSLEPGTFDAEVGGLLDPQLTVKMVVRIHNPTERRAKVDDNRVELMFDGERVAESRIPTFEVAPGQTASQPVELTLRPGRELLKAGAEGVGSLFSKGVLDTLKGLADLDRYTVKLIIPTAAGEFPISLYDPKKKKKKKPEPR